jgi:hypothetical protein
VGGSKKPGVGVEPSLAGELSRNANAVKDRPALTKLISPANSPFSRLIKKIDKDRWTQE